MFKDYQDMIRFQETFSSDYLLYTLEENDDLPPSKYIINTTVITPHMYLCISLEYYENQWQKPEDTRQQNTL